MASPRKRKPYDPSKPVHNRIAKEYSVGVKSHIVYVEVDDPYELGARIMAARSVRDDPLGDSFARGNIDQAMLAGGRAFQDTFRDAERGPRAFEMREWVDGGLAPEPLTERQRRAGKQLAVVYLALGADGSALAHDVLVHALTMRSICKSRGLEGKRWEEFFGLRFREVLNRLAKVYGFSNVADDSRRVT